MRCLLESAIFAKANDLGFSPLAPSAGEPRPRKIRDEYAGNEKHSDDELLQLSRYVRKPHAVAKRPEEEDGEEHPDNGPAAPVDVHAAQDDRGDHAEDHSVCVVPPGGTVLANEYRRPARR